MERLIKNISIPVDGSKNSLRSIDYLGLIYSSSTMNISVNLIYIMPSLPSLIENGGKIDKNTYASVIKAEKKILDQATGMLENAKELLIEKGFDNETIKISYKKQRSGVAKDVCEWASGKKTDALLLTRRGRGETDLEALFMGRVSNNIVEACKESPVWILGGQAPSNKVLIALDCSENALRAVDHAAFMLSDTDCPITIFHAIRDLKRFIPNEIVDDAPELEELWNRKEGKMFSPYLEKAMSMLENSGISKDRVTTKIAHGTRSPAEDILREARDNEYGTIVLGKRGNSKVKDFLFGSVTRKLLYKAVGRCLWIVQ